MSWQIYICFYQKRMHFHPISVSKCNHNASVYLTYIQQKTVDTLLYLWFSRYISLIWIKKCLKKACCRQGRQGHVYGNHDKLPYQKRQHNKKNGWKYYHCYLIYHLVHWWCQWWALLITWLYLIIIKHKNQRAIKIQSSNERRPIKWYRHLIPYNNVVTYNNKNWG